MLRALRSIQQPRLRDTHTITMNKKPLLALLLAASLAACGQQDPKALMASARQSLEKKEYRAAIIHLKNALDADNALPEARWLLGHTFLLQGDAVSAELELRKALAAGHAQDQIVPELARALFQQGKAKELVAEFDQTRLAAPEAQVSLKTALAGAYAALNEPAKSQAAVDAALQLLPEDPDALLMQARLEVSRDKPDDALRTVARILERAPEHRNALVFKGEVLLYVKQQSDAAQEVFKQAIATHPAFAPGYAGLLTILLTRNQLTEAAETLAQLKKYAPNGGEARYFEAQLAYQQKDYKTARETLQQLLKSAPDNARFLQLAGAVEYQSQSFVQAASFLSKALQAAPQLQFARRMLVATYLASGQPKRALAALPANIDAEAADAELLTLAGQAYLQDGDAKKAEVLLARASKLDPGNSARRTSLAIAHLRGGKTELALNELRDIASSDEGSTADSQLIGLYLRRREFDQALAAVERMQKKLPGNAVPHELRGTVELARGDRAAARRSFEKAIEISPVFFPAVANLAQLDLQDNQPDAARARFEALLKREPKHLQALLALADLKAAAGGSVEEVAALLTGAVRANPAQVGPHRALIDYYLRAQRPQLALAAAQAAVAELPASTDLLEALGRAQQGTGDVNQAIATFRKLAGLLPDSPQPQMRLAAAYLQDKNPDAAQQAWQQALKIQPDYQDAQRAMILYNLQAGKTKEALGIAQKLQVQRPNDATGWVFQGDIQAATSQWGGAVEAYRQALKKGPSSLLAVKLHAALLAGGKPQEAATFAKGWLVEHPGDPMLQGHLGDVALFAKDYAGAEKIYRSALEQAPQSHWIVNNLAWVLTQQKKPESLELAQKANRLAPNQPPYMDTLAQALSLAGQHAKAVELGKNVIQLKPDNPLYKLSLAKIYLAAGDRNSARTELDGLAALGTKFPNQDEVGKLRATL